MIGYIFVLTAWSILMIVVGMLVRRKDNDSYIEQLKKDVEFHKSQKEQVVEGVRRLVKENNNLKERNLQLIHENKKLKKQLDNQGNVTYNYYINKDK